MYHFYDPLHISTFSNEHFKLLHNKVSILTTLTMSPFVCTADFIRAFRVTLQEFYGLNDFLVCARIIKLKSSSHKAKTTMRPTL